MKKNVGFIIGHNLPGCLPDGEPDFYPDAESAQFGFVDMIEEALAFSDVGLIEDVMIREWATRITECELDSMKLSDEYNVMIDGRIYWITKYLVASDIVKAGVDA